jgi:hypothetical protein
VPPVGGLQAFGSPTVTASCSGAAYATASATAPLKVVGGQSFTSGMKLTSAGCDTTYTWHVAGKVRTYTAWAYLDIADSGAQQLAFSSGGLPLAFTVNGQTLSQVQVGPSGVQFIVNVTGAQNISIVIPVSGGSAGIVDITNEAVTGS